MCACSDKQQKQLVFLNFIHQQPIRLNVTFSAPNIIARQRMVMVLRRQRDFVGKLFYNFPQLFFVISAFDDSL